MRCAPPKLPEVGWGAMVTPVSFFHLLHGTQRSYHCKSDIFMVHFLISLNMSQERI